VATAERVSGRVGVQRWRAAWPPWASDAVWWLQLNTCCMSRRGCLDCTSVATRLSRSASAEPSQVCCLGIGLRSLFAGWQARTATTLLPHSSSRSRSGLSGASSALHGLLVGFGSLSDYHRRAAGAAIELLLPEFACMKEAVAYCLGAFATSSAGDTRSQDRT